MLHIYLSRSENKGYTLVVHSNSKVPFLGKKQDAAFSSSLFWLSYLPTPPLGQDMTHGQFLSGV